jgi:hypothetical protein
MGMDNQHMGMGISKPSPTAGLATKFTVVILFLIMYLIITLIKNSVQILPKAGRQMLIYIEVILVDSTVLLYNPPQTPNKPEVILVDF